MKPFPITRFLADVFRRFYAEYPRECNISLGIMLAVIILSGGIMVVPAAFLMLCFAWYFELLLYVGYLVLLPVFLFVLWALGRSK